MAGVDVVAAGGSDWVVFAGADGYPADEAYFLHDIIHTIGTALTGHPQLNADCLSTWVAERHAQIEQGTLVYIAHQLDVLGRVPVRMGGKDRSGSLRLRGHMSTEHLLREFYN